MCLSSFILPMISQFHNFMQQFSEDMENTEMVLETGRISKPNEIEYTFLFGHQTNKYFKSFGNLAKFK
jgi:hypothetical protein